MVQVFKEFTTNAALQLGDLSIFEDTETKLPELYSFVWSKDTAIHLNVDLEPVTIPPHSIAAFTPLQNITNIQGENGIVYQFNREFYCVKDHDKEVSCLGLLFFGNETTPIIPLNTKEQHRYALLHETFIEELNTTDTIQAEMLRMLLARFIIKTTRILKNEVKVSLPQEGSIDLLRDFNFMVETHFREARNVAFYADKLYKSPKTLSNNFSKYKKSPLQIIHDRIVLEAKRMLTYSNLSAKEIAFDLGFDDPSHLSRLFKKQTGVSPAVFKSQLMAHKTTKTVAKGTFDM